MNRRRFLAAAAAAPFALREVPAALAAAAPLAFVTADTESHVAVVSPDPNSTYSGGTNANRM